MYIHLEFEVLAPVLKTTKGIGPIPNCHKPPVPLLPNSKGQGLKYQTLKIRVLSLLCFQGELTKWIFVSCQSTHNSPLDFDITCGSKCDVTEAWFTIGRKAAIRPLRPNFTAILSAVKDTI